MTTSSILKLRCFSRSVAKPGLSFQSIIRRRQGPFFKVTPFGQADIIRGVRNKSIFVIIYPEPVEG